MAKIQKPGASPQSWIGGLGAKRLAAQQPAKKKAAGLDHGGGDPALGGLPKKAADQLALAGVPSRVIAKHGAAFSEALADVVALSRSTASLDAWQAKSAGRAFEQVYKVLGQQLDRLPAEARAAAAKSGMAAFKALVDSVGANERLVPSLASATGLVDAGVRFLNRKKLELTDEQAAQLPKEAVDATLALIERMEGRTGIGTALNVYSRLVEQVELGFGKYGHAERAALFGQALELIADATPPGGVDLAIMAKLGELVAERASEFPNDSARALAAAKKDYLAVGADRLAEVTAGLGEVAANAAPVAVAQAALEEGLRKVAEASPSGPDALYASIDKLRAEGRRFGPSLAGQPARPGRPVRPARPAQLGAYPEIGRVLERMAGTASVATALEFFAPRLNVLNTQPLAVAALKLVAEAPDVAQMAAGIIEVGNGLRGKTTKQQPDLAAAAARLQELSPPMALHVALAFAPQLAAGAGTAALLAAMIDFAKEARPDNPAAALASFSARYAAAAAQIARNPQIAPEREEILKAIATRGPAAPMDVKWAQLLLGSLQTVKIQFPQMKVAELVGDGPNGEPGMFKLTDPKVKFATAPGTYLTGLLQAAKATAVGNAALQTELARIAMSISLEVGHIQNGAKLQNPQILKDWTQSITQPDSLKVAAGPKRAVALRGQQQSVASFVSAHAALPPDFALTAGQHLTPEQLAWAMEKIGSTRGRETVHSLRDFVFGCVAADRMDLIEAARTSKSAPKAIANVLREVAQSYRTNAIGDVPFDAMIEGLNAGVDPVGDLVDGRAKTALKGVNLHELAEGKVSQQGLEEVMRLAPNVAELLTHYTPGFKSMDADVDMGALRQPFLDVLKSVVQGTWPTPKYEDEVGVRQMAILTPEQQAIWRSTTITAADRPAEKNEPAKYPKAMNLLSGLKEFLPKVKLVDADGKKLTLDAATAAKVREHRDQAIEKLRASEKGSDAHRALSRSLTSVNTNLAVLELHEFLAQRLGEGARNPAETLVAAKPVLAAAASAFKKLGAPGASEAAQDVLREASDIRSSGRQGQYVADEDGLTHLIASHTSGCLSFGDKRRRWGVVGALADASTKMLRVYNGEKQVYRTFMRLVSVKLPNYEGPALYIETPRPDGGGNAADLELMYQGLMEKGRAMGIPVMGGGGKLPAGWKQVNGKPAITFDFGHTGVQHSDRVGQMKNQKLAGKSWTLQPNLLVQFPPELAV